MDMSLSKLGEMVKNSKTWCAAEHGVVNSGTWLSNWTTTITERSLTHCQQLGTDNTAWAKKNNNNNVKMYIPNILKVTCFKHFVIPLLKNHCLQSHLTYLWTQTWLALEMFFLSLPINWIHSVCWLKCPSVGVACSERCPCSQTLATVHAWWCPSSLNCSLVAVITV